MNKFFTKSIFFTAINFTVLASVCAASVPQIEYSYYSSKSDRGGFFFEQRVLSCLKKIFKYCKEKNAKKAIKKLKEMKQEIENQYNTHLSFSEAIDHIQEELKEKGVPFSKSQLKKIKAFFKGKLKAEGGQLDLELQIGITAACAGVFLLFIPIPICTAVGTELLVFGFGALTAYQTEIFKKD